MKLQLAALDLDGTLLEKDKTILPALWEKIAELRCRGVRFVIASGRTFPSARLIARELGLTLPVIACNGSMTKGVEDEAPHTHWTLPKSLAEEVLQYVGRKEAQALRFLFVGDRILTDTPHAWANQYEEALGVKFEWVDNLLSRVEEDPTMIVYVVEKNKTMPLSAELRGILESRACITNSHAAFIEIMHPAASKGRALEDLCRNLQIPREAVLAIGDNRNDLPMLRYAGVGALVGNSPEEIRSHADYVAQGENGAGVLEVLEKFFS